MDNMSIGNEQLSAINALLDALSLQRLPKTTGQPLRAWDAADEYLLAHIWAHGPRQTTEPNTLVVNDAFGALTVALGQGLSTHSSCPHHCTLWSDSLVAHRATEHNWEIAKIASAHGNGLVANSTRQTPIYQPSTLPPATHPVQFDWVVIKLPKNLALLAAQLQQLKPYISANTHIVAGGMVKHWPKQAQSLFEQYLGHSHTSLAVKKARLLFCTPHERHQCHENDNNKSHAQRLNQPSNSIKVEAPCLRHAHTLNIPDYALTLHQHANVFGAKHLDIGARLMLEQFDRLPKQARQVIDLGCGNGVLGIVAQRLRPYETVHFVDESYMAVDSASFNHAQTLPHKHAQFWASHCLDEVDVQDVDLVLCNPPFHQQQSLDTRVAHTMFEQAKQRLRQGGELWVVGNRHLGYNALLNRLMGNAQLLAQNSKFQVIRAVAR